jgi:hypothetical protein
MNYISLRQSFLDSLNSSVTCPISFHQNMFSDALVELYWVISGIKQNAQLCIPESFLSPVIASCESKDIYWSVSPIALKGIPSSANPAYYHFSIEISTVECLPPEEKLRQVFIARNKEQITAYKATQHVEDSVERGALLEYPECCIKFFNNSWKQACEKYQGDLTPFVITNSKRKRAFPFKTNYFTGLFGIPVVSHIPCSFSCKATIYQTNQRLMKLSQEQPELTESLVRLMKCPILYSASMGTALITCWRAITLNRIRCQHALLTAESYWGDILELTGSIESNSSGRVVLFSGGDKHHLAGDNRLLFWH